MASGVSRPPGRSRSERQAQHAGHRGRVIGRKTGEAARTKRGMCGCQRAAIKAGQRIDQVKGAMRHPAAPWLPESRFDFATAPIPPAPPLKAGTGEVARPFRLDPVTKPNLNSVRIGEWPNPQVFDSTLDLESPCRGVGQTGRFRHPAGAR